jgi:predicted HAD superfamily phosphohydrolase
MGRDPASPGLWLLFWISLAFSSYAMASCVTIKQTARKTSETELDLDSFQIPEELWQKYKLLKVFKLTSWSGSQVRTIFMTLRQKTQIPAGCRNVLRKPSPKEIIGFYW